MELVGKVVSFLDGKKTYIVAFSMAMYAVFVLGPQTPEGQKMLLEAAGIAGLRSGITKAQ